MDNDKDVKYRELSPVVAALMAFTSIGIGVCGFGPVTSELKTGEAYTLAVVFGQGVKVHRGTSPEAYWINIGWQVLGFAIAIALGVGGLYRIYANHRKRTKN